MVRKLSLVAVILSVVALMCLPMAAQAQGGPGGFGGRPGMGGPGGPGGFGGRGIDRLTTTLKLSPDQVKKITPIFDIYRKKQQALNAERDAKIDKFLTPAQAAQYKAMSTRRFGGPGGPGGMGGMGGRPGGMGGPGGPRPH